MEPDYRKLFAELSEHVLKENAAIVTGIMLDNKIGIDLFIKANKQTTDFLLKNSDAVKKAKLASEADEFLNKEA